MKSITMAFAVAMALMSFGCKKKGNDSAAAMAKMTEFKDQMCKCAEHDTKCAQTVSDAMTKWSQEQAKNQKEPPKMSEEDTKKAAAIGEEMGKCMQAAMGAGAAGSAEGSAAPEGSAAGSAAPEGSAAGSAAPEGSAAGSAAPAAGSAAGSAEKK
jgi:hypothetical protein